MRIMWRSMQLLNYCFSNKRTVSQDFRTGNITYSIYLGYLDCIFMFNNSEQNLHQFIGTSEWDAFPFLNLNWLLLGNENLTKFCFYVRIWFPELSDFGESTKLLGSTYLKINSLQLRVILHCMQFWKAKVANQQGESLFPVENGAKLTYVNHTSKFGWEIESYTQRFVMIFFWNVNFMQEFFKNVRRKYLRVTRNTIQKELNVKFSLCL